MAWEGIVAEGFPESMMAFFASARSPEEYTALAWFLEDGMGKFYASLAGMLTVSGAVRLFRHLASAEERHKTELKMLYNRLSSKEENADFPGVSLLEHSHDPVMEGGVSLEEGLRWAKGKTTREILELSIALESNAYDRYIVMQRNVEDTQSQQVFDLLSREEKRHIARMTDLFDLLP